MQTNQMFVSYDGVFMNVKLTSTMFLIFLNKTKILKKEMVPKFNVNI
jgi:hypothetical protein